MNHVPMMHYCSGKPFMEMSELERMQLIRANRTGRIPPEKPKEKPKKAKSSGPRKTTRKRKPADPAKAFLKQLEKLPPTQRAKLLAQMQTKIKGD